MPRLFLGVLQVGQSTNGNLWSDDYTININFTSSVNASSIQVLTTGKTNLDYIPVQGWTCATGTTYTSGQTCVVRVRYQPMAVGPRYGAIVFYNSTNKVLGTIYLGGGGAGAVV